MTSDRSAEGAVPPIRVGVDVMPVDLVADSIRRLGDRYLERVFTAQEVACCAGPPPVAAAGLAARFAAKEATIKVLRPAGHHPDWRSMEVCRDGDGGCRMSLSGTAAAMAEAAGITHLAVSLTHEEGIGAAVVVALCGGQAGGPGHRSAAAP